MLQKFRQFIQDNQLFSEKGAILVAVSGGMDSVALCSLLHQAGITFGIAHCNFKLRGDESDRDEEFVRQLALDYGVKFHCKSFATNEYAGNKGISIQMAARDLRYEWFDQLIKTEGYKSAATAHHLDDQTETFFINLLRGSGIAGIHGILPKQGTIVRPLLFAKREEIDEFVRDNRLPYREDSSNKSRKYLRNRLRHELLPVLMNIDPAFSQKLDQTMHHIRGVEDILNQKVTEIASRIVVKKLDCFQIEIEKLKELQPLDTWLYLILQPFGFSASVVKEIEKALDGIPGKMFFSPTHRLVKDRELLLVEPLENLKIEQKEFLIEAETPAISLPFPMEFQTLPVAETLDILHNPSFACLDAGKLTYPLTLRLWQNGDRFIPFGMKGWKKVSDFLIDLKLSIPEKEKIWVLLSAGDVVWIVGKRIDERYRITKQTQQAKVIHLVQASISTG
jgi:tRNA(Ile)-lysidine synthase